MRGCTVLEWSALSFFRAFEFVSWVARCFGAGWGCAGRVGGILEGARGMWFASIGWLLIKLLAQHWARTPSSDMHCSLFRL